MVMPKKAQVLSMLNRMHQLRETASFEVSDSVLCHGDVWGGNLILTPEEEVYFVDWESCCLARPEIDLLNYIGDDFPDFLAAYEDARDRQVCLSADIFGFLQYRRHLSNLTAWMVNILYDNRSEEQSAHDLYLIREHCMDRWESIEPQITEVRTTLQRR